METIRTVVLIPESTRKADGGGPLPRTDRAFEDALPREDQRRMILLRDQVRRAAVGSVGSPQELLPAHQRFRGNMYRAIGEEAWARRVEGVEVLIASGLYGLVTSREPVMNYAVSMAEPLEGLGRLNRWWRDHGLPSLLRGYLEAVHPLEVVDLLSLEYREAVEGYAGGLRGPKVRTIDFPGMGRGSQPRRGEKVAEILLSGRLSTESGPS